MEKHIEQFLLTADAKALATCSADGRVNVVPVSSIRIVGGNIILVNYFMDKTLQNMREVPYVSLVAWSQMIGYQIKGSVEYITTGPLFNEVVAWIHDTIPGRVVKGVISISPEEIYDIAPTKNTKESIAEMTPL